MASPERLGRGPDAPLLTILETPGLGNRSYLVEADGWAVAVDVQRDLDRVERILQRRGLRLAAVVETHVHNDYVTGGLALARAHDADYVVPAGPELGFEATRGHEGDLVLAGPLRLRVITTPGHTDAHAVYSVQVDDGPAAGAFTGGSLLLGGTGRTDLLGTDRAEELARAQYWSVRRLARLLPASARLLPTHGFGSFCLAGQAVPSAGDTVADQLEVNPAFLLDEDDFVANLLGRLGPYPTYFPLMGPRNAAGPDAADLSRAPEVAYDELAQRAAAGGWVLDVRQRAEHARGHVPGSINVDASGALATWTGWTIPIEQPITLVAADEEQARDAQRELVRIGIDRLAGAHVTDSEPTGVVGGATRRRAHFGDLAEALRRVDVPALVDVRDDVEWRQGHLAGAVHVPAHQAAAGGRDGRIPADAWLYCGVGFRAAVAASVLARDGVTTVLVDDSLSYARMSGLPWCEGTDCPDDHCQAGAETLDLTEVTTTKAAAPA